MIYNDCFALYEKENPKVTVEAKPKEETLFEAEVSEVKPQEFTLPEGFEDALVNKITNAILEKIQPKEDTE